MSNKKQIGIIGAGIVGLSCALWIQRAGYDVTLIDRDAPGLGASYGNAGVFANFARLPYTKFSMLSQIPGMLIDKNSPLSISTHYIPSLLPYGWSYIKSCFKYNMVKEAMNHLQAQAIAADKDLIKMTASDHLINNVGSLGLFATDKNFAIAKKNDLKERADQGVNLELLDAKSVHDLEPDLEPFYAGGVYYPDTRSTINPLTLSQQYYQYFIENGGHFVREEVKFIDNTKQPIQVETTLKTFAFDQLVIAAGTASKTLISQLGMSIPLVSERGYHLTLSVDDKTIKRPIAWLDNSIFVAPMSDGIRLAGTAEFAAPDRQPSPQRMQCMLRHAKTMLGTSATVTKNWVGSRPSTPDSLPVIGTHPSDQRVCLAFGHGHLGLTLSAITGKLIAEVIQGLPTSVCLKGFSPVRFR